MARPKVLLQTTIPYAKDDWHVGRFSLLCEQLARRHDVVARNREPAPSGNDPVLSQLGDSDFSQVWLLAVDTGDGLSEDDVAGLHAFRRAGGGIVTARDHQDLGLSLAKLGALGRVNFFHSAHPEPDPERRKRDDPYTLAIDFPNYHSGWNGDYQTIEPSTPTHELLRSDKAPGGVIRHFPAHPHEGAVGCEECPSAIALAQGTSSVTGRRFNLAVAIENDRDEDETPLGRAVAESTFHHFADYNWDPSSGCPSFVAEAPGDGIAKDPESLAIFKDYIDNVARWLARS